MSARVGFGGGNKEVKEITENRDEGPVLNDRDPLGVQQPSKLTYNSSDMLDFFFCLHSSGLTHSRYTE